MKLAGKAVVVTGAGSGIGRQVALQALGRGAKVAGVDLRQEGLDATAELAAEVTELAMFQADVTDRAAIEALPAGITDAIGAPDAVIHCAGIIQPFVKLAELDC